MLLYQLKFCNGELAALLYITLRASDKRTNSEIASEITLITDNMDTNLFYEDLDSAINSIDLLLKRKGIFCTRVYATDIILLE